MSQIAGWNVIFLDSVDSTNLEAKRMSKTVKNDTLIIADIQTAGRGRLDRRWESPRGSGLYMTQLFYPKNIKAELASGAVFLSAIALCEAIKDLTGIVPKIKWPNDIVIGTKKVCGMLAECGFESDMCSWIALGSGLNINKESLPDSLIYAASLAEYADSVPSRAQIIENYLPKFNRLRDIWEAKGLSPIIDIMRKHSATIGKDIRVNGEEAKALDIAPDGSLIIMQDNMQKKVLAGDVSVRGLTDYV